MKYLLAFSLLLSFTIAKAQNLYQEFSQAFEAADTAACVNILDEWSKRPNPEAEFYTAAFNFHFWQSEREVVQLNYGPPPANEEVLIISDSTGNPVGYLGSTIMYDYKQLEKAYEVIDVGIATFPNRLDMRFGKIYVLGSQEEWDAYSKEILKCLNQAEANEMMWAWTLNQPANISKQEFLSSIQEYQANLYNTGEDSLLPYIVNISERVLDFQPDHLESLSNLGAVLLLNNEAEKGLKYLRKAEKINGKDPIILSNIAYAYVMLDVNKTAIKYYKKLKKVGNEEDIAFANSMIAELK